MRVNEIIRHSWEVLEPELDGQGFELVEVEFTRSGSHLILRLYIDREGGVTIDDCAETSHFVSALLDKSDFIRGGYSLEVSSPGVARPVRKPDDFQRFVGEKIKISVAEPIAGRKRFKGVLSKFEDGLISVEQDGQCHQVHIQNVKKANLDR